MLNPRATSIALKTDGTIVAWGDNTYTLTNVPSGLNNIVAISAGEKLSLAITATLGVDSVELSNRCPALRFHTFAGRQYSVEYSPNLAIGNWSNLPGGNVQGNGEEVLVTDVDATPTARFYRVREW